MKAHSSISASQSPAFSRKAKVKWAGGTVSKLNEKRQAKQHVSMRM